MADGLPVEALPRWRYRLTAPVIFEVAGCPIAVPAGYRWYIGAAGVALPPLFPGLLRASLIHDWLYDVRTIRAADDAALAEMARLGVPWRWRVAVGVVFRLWRIIAFFRRSS